MAKKPKKSDEDRGEVVRHRAVECEFCGHEYIEPCDSKSKAARCGSKRVKR